MKSVSLLGFRNIRSASMVTDKQVNVFYGKNGSGKTSILEALFYLSRAKSFRTNKRLNLLNTDSSMLAVSVDIEQRSTRHKLGIGLQGNGQAKIKLDGELIHRLSEASVLFPTRIVTPESFDVFFSSPKARRSFFDFGLFHVEHEFKEHWAAYSKLLKQTNALLRRSNPDRRELSFWYKGLVEASARIERFREMFFDKHFSKAIEALADELAANENVDLIAGLEIRYKKKLFSQSEGISLEQQVDRQIERDLRYKQVGFGPNRADVLFIQDGEDIGNKLSRGQSKMLFYLLEIAMVKIIRAMTNKNILLLVDDLPSEVDENTRSTMLEMLLHSEAQVFVTGIENKIAKEFMNYTNSVNVFHVEHGTVRPENMEQLCP